MPGKQRDGNNCNVPGARTNARNHILPLGTWQADGRLTDPTLVLDTSPRTAGLDVFAGSPADGTWSLFVADLSTGGLHQVNSWTLHVTVVPVPEPRTALLSASALLCCVGRRRRA